MFGDKEAVMPDPGEKSEVRTHTRRTKKGVSTVQQHQRKRKPKKAQPSKPVVEKPKARGKGSRKKHHDVGEYVPGARKHTWHRVNMDNLPELEAQGETEAVKRVTKKAVLGDAGDVEYLQGLGDTAGAAMLKTEIYKQVAAKAPQSAEGRRLYVEGINLLEHTLDTLHTVDQVADWIRDEKDLLRHQTRPVTPPLDGAGILAHVGKSDDWEGDDHWSGGWYHVKIGDRRVKIGADTMKAAGYSGIRWLPGDKYQLMEKVEGYTKSPEARQVASLGERYIKQITDYSRSRGRTKLWRTISKARQAEKEDDWSWAEKKKVTRKSKGGRWRRVLSGGQRVGGRDVSHIKMGDQLNDEFGLRAVQYGNWVADAEAGAHVQRAAEALADLADLLGIDPQALAHHHKLALAFGARGKGGWTRAHYEPNEVIINLTKTKGNGTLCHEWAHFMDHTLSGSVIPGKLNVITTASGKVVRDEKGDPVARYGSGGQRREDLPNEVTQAMQAVVKAMRTPAGERDLGFTREEHQREYQAIQSDSTVLRMKNRAGVLSDEDREAFNARVDKWKSNAKLLASLKQSKYLTDAETLGSYWQSPHEMFARAFESWAEDKLHAQRRRSPYLVDGTRRQYNLARGKTENLEPYPQGEERKAIHAAMDNLVSVMKKLGTMEKALERMIMNKSAMPGMPQAEPGTRPPRPGLVFDKMKHRWVRQNKEQPKPRQPAQAQPEEPGQKQGVGADHADVGKTVSFKGEDGSEIQGKVKYGGPEGVTVMDERGGLHKVRKGQYQEGGAGEQKQPQEKPQADARPAEGEKPAAAPEGKDAGEGPLNGDGEINEADIYDEPMPELPDGFNDLPKIERAKMTAKWGEVKREIDNRFPEREYNGESIEGAKQSATEHWREMAKQGWVGENNVVYGEQFIDTLAGNLEAAGVAPKDAAHLMQGAMRRLAHQEIEAARRTLGDHGVRHVQKNIENLSNAFDALTAGGLEITPKQRLLGTIVMLNHDMGYAIPAIARGGFDVANNYHPQASAELWKQETAEDDTYNRVFGKAMVDHAVDMISNHSGSNIDWEGDPMGTSIRLADNSHLFYDKMPELLYKNKTAMDLLTKVHLATKGGLDVKPIKQALIKHIESRTDLSPPQKTALLEAAKEVGQLTPHFLVSRLAGRDMQMKFDAKTKTMNVNVEQSPLRRMIGRVFGDDHVDKQFGKMLEDFGHDDPKKILKSGPPPAVDMDGKGGSSMRFAWTPPNTEANETERQYQEVAEASKAEWDRIQGLEGDEKQKSLDAWMGTLAKALLRFMLKAKVPTAAAGAKAMAKPPEKPDEVGEHLKGARLRFRHPYSGEDTVGTGHRAGPRGITVLDDDGRAHKVEHGHYVQHREIDGVGTGTPTEDLDTAATEESAKHGEAFDSLRETAASSKEYDEHRAEHMKVGPRSRVGTLATAAGVYQAAGYGADHGIKRGQVSFDDEAGHALIKDDIGVKRIEDEKLVSAMKHYHGATDDDDADLFSHGGKGFTGGDVDRYTRGYVKSGLEGLNGLMATHNYVNGAKDGGDLDDLDTRHRGVDHTVKTYLRRGGKAGDDFLDDVHRADVWGRGGKK